MQKQFSISLKSGNKSVYAWLNEQIHQDSVFQTTMKFTTLSCEVFNGDRDKINIVAFVTNPNLSGLFCFLFLNFFWMGNDKFHLKTKNGPENIPSLTNRIKWIYSGFEIFLDNS